MWTICRKNNKRQEKWKTQAKKVIGGGKGLRGKIPRDSLNWKKPKKTPTKNNFTKYENKKSYGKLNTYIYTHT